MAKKRNIIVGQSGGPTSVINSSLAGVYKTAKERGFHKVYGMLHGIQGFLDEQYVDLSTQIHSDMDIELLKRTPSAFLGSCRYKLPDIHENPDIYDKIFNILDKLDIETFIYIGGNDSMDTIKKLSDYAILKGYTQKFLGVPKTIDNDLALTDHTPGFGSAAKYIAASTKEVIRDALGLTYHKSMITVIEVMGRNAGWLTGATALAKTEECDGPDLIYLPEIPAVKAADEGDTGKMVVIDRVSDDPYMSAAGIYDVHRIANNEKVVPRNWVNREGNYVTDEFINYIEPLIQGDYQPFMVNGLPQHLVLRKK